MIFVEAWIGNHRMRNLSSPRAWILHREWFCWTLVNWRVDAVQVCGFIESSLHFHTSMVGHFHLNSFRNKVFRKSTCFVQLQKSSNGFHWWCLPIFSDQIILWGNYSINENNSVSIWRYWRPPLIIDDTHHRHQYQCGGMKHRSSAVELERYFTHWITSGRTVGKASFSPFALTSPLVTRFMIVYHLFMFKFLELLQRWSKALM